MEALPAVYPEQRAAPVDCTRQPFCEEAQEMGLKVAIIGLSDTTRHLIPWDDKTIEKWGLPWDGYQARMDRLFEMHDLRLLESEHSKRKSDYFQQLLECEVPLYMQERFENAVRYPFEEVAKTTGYYWNSSIAYALAMAIHECAEEISVYGVDMKSDDEYGYQKPNMEYLIGLATGMGIKMNIPKESPLCKFQPHGIKFYDHVPNYVDRYGWLG